MVYLVDYKHRLTEDDIAWQLQFLDDDERGRLGIDDEDGRLSHDGRSRSPEAKPVGQVQTSANKNEAELTEDERVEQFTVRKNIYRDMRKRFFSKYVWRFGEVTNQESSTSNSRDCQRILVT